MGKNIRIKQTVTLRHQANLGEEIKDVEFEAGAELQILQRFKTAFLAKDGDGQIFNVKKELAEEA